MFMIIIACLVTGLALFWVGMLKRALREGKEASACGFCGQQMACTKARSKTKSRIGNVVC
jgi:hypothetical protein